MKPAEFIKFYLKLENQTPFQKIIYDLANEIEDDRKMVADGVERIISHWMLIQQEPERYDPICSDPVKTLLTRLKTNLSRFNQLMEFLKKTKDDVRNVFGQTYSVFDLSKFSANDLILVKKAQPTNQHYVLQSPDTNQDDPSYWFTLPGRVDGFRPLEELKKQGFSEAFIDLCNDAWNENCLWIKFVIY